MSAVTPPADRRALLQSAWQAIGDLQAKLEAVERARTEPIAIVGLGCRFPGGANDPEAYWQLLREGRDAVGPAPTNRWNMADFADQGIAWYGGFLDEIDGFDPKFFGITPREAASMDPQQRLVLEVSWEALERAGIAPDRLTGSETGVFLGITTNDYAQLAKQGGPQQLDVYTATGTALNAAAGRVAYTLGLQGPCLSIDTACSSSLVALHLACQSLRSGESDLALAGGVNAILTPDAFVCFSKWGMMAPDGRCKTFDARADGFVRAEGCGIVVLKRLSEAVTNGDNILAVIRGSAVNQDGRSSGLTVPNGLAQQAVIRRALANAGLRPLDVSYVETHGTGTALGDPIEVEALGAALGPGRDDAHPLTIGSVKTNLGHLESASGMAGLIKVVLSLQHEALPPHLHLQARSPRIPWPNFPILIPQALTPWPRSDRRRIAGVSGFGFSGTNAHVILEEAPRVEPAASPVDRSRRILTLSARTEPALQQLADRFAQHALEPFGAAAYTANTGRARFAQRLALIAASGEDAREKLAAFARGQIDASVITGGAPLSHRPKIAFLFTGQGAQYVGMGRQLYDTQPTFRAALDRCDEILRPQLGQSLLALLYPPAASEPPPSKLDQTRFTQPALFALEYALTELWKSWGVRPTAALGHSVGEYVAACVAGVFSLEDGLRLIAERGRLMQALPQDGDMVAVFADEATVAAALSPFRATVSIAALNGPENVVVSGLRTDVQMVIDQLTARGLQSRRLTVSHAFHSPLMQPILAAFEQAAASVKFAAPQIDLISNVTGQRATTAITSAAYWRQHLLAPVQFATSMQTLQQAGYNTFVEIGPSPTLLGLARRCLPDSDARWLPSVRAGREDWAQMLESLGTLWVAGVEIDWAGFERAAAAPRRVALPTYPFERQRYWLDAPARRTPDPLAGARPASSAPTHPLLGRRSWSPLIEEILFESPVSSTWPPYLDHHRIYGAAIFPATGYIEMALAAAATVGPAPYTLLDLNLQEALILTDDQFRTAQLVLVVGDQAATFRALSWQGEPAAPPNGPTSPAEWTLHATGEVRTRQPAASDQAESLRAIQARCATALSAPDYYARLKDIGLDYGASFQGITQLWRGTDEVVGEVQLPELYAAEIDHYWLHPALFDGCFQLLGAVWPAAEASAESAVYLPIGAKRLEVFERAGRQVWCHARIERDAAAGRAGRAEMLSGDLQLFDQTGRLIARLAGLQLKRATRATLRQIAPAGRFNEWLYEIDWRPAALGAQPSDRAATEPWLICADGQGFGAAVAARLRADGERCQVVTSPEELPVGAVQPAWGAVICLWPLDAVRHDPAAASVAIVRLVQALAHSAQPAPRLWLITRGAQAIAAEPIAVEQAPVWGLGRVLTLEQPDLRCGCLDLDPAASIARAVEQLLAEVRAADVEDQVAYRNETRLVARLLERAAVAARHPAPLRLTIAARGTFDHLTVQPIARRSPGPGEVEIEVRASGLNFRDVLNALDLYPGAADAPGNECAGTIVAVGEGVSHFQLGDRVVAMADACFSSYVIARAELVACQPEQFSFVEAAAIPIAYLTAKYALDQRGHLQAGERVLIHAAAGGVGLAAVQLALKAGAEIYATAGSDEKRAYLKSLGVRHVMDSRTLDFAAEIMRLTDGEGVDVVLNSLTDDFIAKSLAVLKTGGRFLEIGKRGIWTREQIESLGRNLQYHVIFLGEICQTDPALIQSMLQTALADLGRGALKMLPVQVFPLDRAAEAFRYMARAKHIGKIVISLPAGDWALNAAKPLIQPAATYLITGGLGGLGLQTAHWLVEQGARQLVLMSRHAPSSATQTALQDLRQLGADVRVWPADVADYDQLARVLEAINATLPPLRGIIHAAGALADGALAQQDRARFEKVFAPKALGAWNLQRLTRSLPLDFFVLFSSAAAELGSAGQSNYAAANAFMDALAHDRRAHGQPALSINWGAWAEVGMAAALDERAQRRLQNSGLGRIAPPAGRQMLARLLRSNGAQLIAAPIDWSQLVLASGPERLPPLLSDQARQVQVTAAARRVPRRDDHGARSAPTDWPQQLAAAAPERRAELIANYLRGEAARVMGVRAAELLSLDQPLNDLGLDSLMAMELKNRLESDLGVRLPVRQFLEGPTLTGLAAQAHAQWLESGASRAPIAAAPAAAVAHIDQLSDAEVTAMLNALLADHEATHD